MPTPRCSGARWNRWTASACATPCCTCPPCRPARWPRPPPATRPRPATRPPPAARRSRRNRPAPVRMPMPIPGPARRPRQNRVQCPQWSLRRSPPTWSSWAGGTSPRRAGNAALAATGCAWRPAAMAAARCCSKWACWSASRWPCRSRPAISIWRRCVRCGRAPPPGPPCSCCTWKAKRSVTRPATGPLAAGSTPPCRHPPCFPPTPTRAPTPETTTAATTTLATTPETTLARTRLRLQGVRPARRWSRSTPNWWCRGP